LATWRINDKAFSDDWPLLASLIFVCAYSSAASVWQARRSAQRDLLPRKRRLEALLKQLDGQE
jgi:hypothetical protein